MECLGVLAYLLTKFAAYSGWCYLGLRWFDPSREKEGQRQPVLWILAVIDGSLFRDGHLSSGLNDEQRGEKFNADVFRRLRSRSHCRVVAHAADPAPPGSRSSIRCLGCRRSGYFLSGRHSAGHYGGRRGARRKALLLAQILSPPCEAEL